MLRQRVFFQHHRVKRMPQLVGMNERLELPEPGRFRLGRGNQSRGGQSGQKSALPLGRAHDKTGMDRLFSQMGEIDIGRQICLARSRQRVVTTTMRPIPAQSACRPVRCKIIGRLPSVIKK